MQMAEKPPRFESDTVYNKCMKSVSTTTAQQIRIIPEQLGSEQIQFLSFILKVFFYEIFHLFLPTIYIVNVSSHEPMTLIISSYEFWCNCLLHSVNRLYGLIYWMLAVHFEFQKCSIRIENYVYWSDHIPFVNWGFGRNHFSHFDVDRVAKNDFVNRFDYNVAIPLKFSLRPNKNKFRMPTNDRK